MGVISPGHHRFCIGHRGFLSSPRGDEIADRLRQALAWARQELEGRVMKRRHERAAEAVSSFVDRELAIIGDIRQGLDDVEAKHIVSQEDAAIEVFAVIESAAQKRSA